MTAHRSLPRRVHSTSLWRGKYREEAHITDISDAQQTTELPPEAERDARRAFLALGLGEAALHAITDLGYITPTSIQEQTIPLLLAGQDVIAQAPTGTGKTAAYGLPIIERLDEG